MARRNPARESRAAAATIPRRLPPRAAGNRLRPSHRCPGVPPGSRRLLAWMPGSRRRTGRADRRAVAGLEPAGSHGPGPCPRARWPGCATRRGRPRRAGPPRARPGRGGPARLRPAARLSTRGRTATSRPGRAARRPRAPDRTPYYGRPALSAGQARGRRTSHPGCACGERIAARGSVSPVGRFVGSLTGGSADDLERSRERANRARAAEPGYADAEGAGAAASTASL